MYPRNFTESIVEDATFGWLASLSYAVLHVPDISVSEPTTERSDLERVARGIYRLSEHPITEHHGLAIAGAAVPPALRERIPPPCD